ncbi:MAG: exodeoxyribonuclease VII small subunit [Ruminococcaceae bacterium]|nr:exodeoxyribonuclease VII small subunit [Oscillospiraceae bacterium]
MDKDKIQDMKFEEALKRLEEIVRLLEGGQSPLDQSLELYEEAVALVKVCNARLDTAQQKVTMLGASDITEDN